MEKDNSLLYACYINDIDLIKERIVCVTSAQLKKSTIETGTPLHAAAKNGNIEAIDLLLSAGADIEKGNFMKNSPLLTCIEERKLDIAKYLIEKGANVNKKGCQNRNALSQLILYAWDKDFAEFLVEKGCLVNSTSVDKTPLLEDAAITNNCDAIAFLLKNGIDLANLNKSLCFAIIYNAPKAISYLIELGADLDSMYKSCKGVYKSLYHDILVLDNRGDRRETIKILLEAGADFKMEPVRVVTTLTLEKTKLSPYEYAKERLSKYPENTFIAKNLELIEEYKNKRIPVGEL